VVYTVKSKIALTALAIYPALSGIYWLPGLSGSFISILKLCLLGVFLSVIFLKSINNFFDKTRALRFLIILIIYNASFFPGYFLANNFTGVVVSITNLLMSVAFSFACYSIILKTIQYKTNEYANSIVERIFETYVYSFFPLFAAIVLTVFLMGNPISPFDQSLLEAGFNSRSNKWSIHLSFVIATAYCMFLFSDGVRGKVFGFVILMAAGLFSAASIGRTGLLASLLSIYSITFLFGRVRSQVLLLVITLAGFASLIFYNYDLVVLLMKSSLETGLDLRETSSGRSEQYKLAARLIAENPLTGIGLDNVQPLMLQEYGWPWSVHNLYLRVAAEAGIFAALATFFLVVYPIFLALRVSRRCESYRLLNGASLGIAVSGLIVSIFEPNTIVGSFQNTAIWWLNFGALMARKRYFDGHTVSVKRYAEGGK